MSRWQVMARRYGPWLLIGLLSALWISDLARIWQITNHKDLDVFILAARRLMAGEDIYADAAAFRASIEAGTFSMKDAAVVWPYAYAPLIAMLFMPALALPVETIHALWWGANVLALIGGCWLSLRALGQPKLLAIALALLALYRFEPAIVALRLGQIEIVQFLLLATVLYTLSRDDESWAGLTLGLATGIKFFPGALIVLLVWRRRWRAAAWAAGTALALIAGSFAVAGFERWPSYWDFTSMYGVGGAFAAFPLNQSLNGFFSRNLVRNVFTATLRGVHLPGLAKGLTLGCDLAVIGGSAWLTWQREGWRPHDVAQNQRFALEFALAIAALLLISPHSQVYSFVWVLLPLVVLLARFMAQPGARWSQWAALAAAYALVGRAYTLYHPGLTRLVQAHYLGGALALWGLIAVTLWRDRRH